MTKTERCIEPHANREINPSLTRRVESLLQIKGKETCLKSEDFFYFGLLLNLDV